MVYLEIILFMVWRINVDFPTLAGPQTAYTKFFFCFPNTSSAQRQVSSISEFTSVELTILDFVVFTDTEKSTTTVLAWIMKNSIMQDKTFDEYWVRLIYIIYILSSIDCHKVIANMQIKYIDMKLFIPLYKYYTIIIT